MKQLLTVLFLIPFFGFGQTISPTQYFDSTYDITNENMIPGYDSSLILSGAIHSFPPALYIHKVDLDGNLIAEKSIEAYTADMLFPSKLIGTKDSNYITVHTIIQSSFNKLVFNKWDQNLDTLWQKIYGFNADMKIGSIVEAFDSSLYVSFGDDQDLYVSKLNYYGELRWTKQYSYSSNISPSSLAEMLDSNFCLMSRNNDGTYLTIMDTSGSEILTKEITDHSCHELIQDLSGNIYLLGNNNSSSYASLIKLDSNLNYLDSKSLTYLSWIGNSQLKFVSDTTLIAGGSGGGEFEGTLAIIDTSLIGLESVYFLGEFRTFCPKLDQIYHTQQGPLLGVKATIASGHYTISGFHDDSLACNSLTSVALNPSACNLTTSSVSESIIVGQYIDIQLPIGNPNFGNDHSCITILGSLNENQSPNLSIYPNPSQGTFTIETEGGRIIESLEIHASDGRLVYSDTNLKMTKTQIQLIHLPKGIYFLEAILGNEIINNKIVID